jgi:hypothetical protein
MTTTKKCVVQQHAKIEDANPSVFQLEKELAARFVSESDPSSSEYVDEDGPR